MHLLKPYYRPSWQGGDTAQPLCRKPHFGWCGDDSEPMTLDRSRVNCPFCIFLMRGKAAATEPQRVSLPRYDEYAEWQAPERRKNDDLSHCRAVWKASGGRMFPFCREPVARAGHAQGRAA